MKIKVSGSSNERIQPPATGRHFRRGREITEETTKPKIGLFLGDPTGIGAEITAKVVAQPDIYAAADPVVIGDHRVFASGQRIARLEVPARVVTHFDDVQFGAGELQFLDRPTPSPTVPLGRVQAESGKYVLDTLTFALGLAQRGEIDGLVYAPLNKEAMHAGGSPFEDEIHLFAHTLNWDGSFGELNVLDNLWTSRVTSHVGIHQVSPLITRERVCEAIHLVDSTLKSTGNARPRIAVAALNPHGGEGGMFGPEEKEVIAPAIREAGAAGVDAHGPFPADTVFLRARDGAYDAIVSMYHDQGQIAMKLMGFERGVTVSGGLPIPIATPAHGTAFDIVGQGTANPQALRAAFLIACRMAG